MVFLQLIAFNRIAFIRFAFFGHAACPALPDNTRKGKLVTVEFNERESERKEDGDILV
ncbi:hypothetical protein N825_25500 [Skermanella stibiiresistens SB22]|uniref:Uncharacterized protein n=1 Tax=Skermanella stibiiresistens SB22 TaxID=1385369 RepID=W9GZ83_9PROT|nr:hypothetical protein N825_25500 [Skermanella stibiiresistens SB22]